MDDIRADRLASPWRYSVGMLGITMPGYMYSSYGTFFYRDKLGLSMSLIAIGNILFTLWDALNDPIFGYLSDRTRSGYGRRKPWLLIGAPLFAVFMPMFFSPSRKLGDGIALAVYFTMFLMLTETANTIVSTNYHSLFPELFKNDNDRTAANGLRQALQLVGLIAGVSLTPMLAEKIGYRYLSIILSVTGMGLLVFSILGCREDPHFQDTPAPGLVESFSAVFKNSNFWTVSFTNFFYQATSGLMLAAIPFFVKYALKLPDLFQYQSILCVQPHPDDNEIGAGAIIAKLAVSGCAVSYLTVTNGNLGSDDPDLSREEIAAIRDQELKDAGRHLGASSFYSLGYDDGTLENVTELARDICGAIRTIRPQAVLCPDPWLPYEAHSDHRITGLAVSKAVISSGSVHYQVGNHRQPWGVDAVGYYFTVRPNTIIDVTDFLEQKFEAMAMHKSQMGGGNYEMFRYYFSMKAKELGGRKGFQAGEGLKVLRPIHLHCFADADRI